MNWNKKKFWPTATASLMATSCLLNASDDARMRNIENRISSLECIQNTCCVINPPARPYAAECWGLYVTVDPIIWQAHVNGLGLAIETSGSTNFFNNAGQSHVQNLNYNWDWGFRLGIGLNTNHDAWDILLQWTYWHTDATKKATSNDTHAIYPTIGHPALLLNQTPGSIDAKWDMHYNILDLENGREFYVSKCLTFRPHAGLRTAWIKQELDVDYKELSATNEQQMVLQEDHFWALGIRAGIGMQWGFACGWSVFSNYAGSLLYGYHSIKYREKANDLDLFHVGNFYHIGTSIFDMQIGIRWDWISCDECYHLGFDLGWEHHWHPGQNQFMLFVDEEMNGKFVANQGDLGIQGFFFKARFDF